MPVYNGNSKAKDLYYGGTKIKEAYYNGNKVYSSGPLYYCYSGNNSYFYSTPNNILSLYCYSGNISTMATQSSQLQKYFLDASTGNESYIEVYIAQYGITYRYDRYINGDLYT